MIWGSLCNYRHPGPRRVWKGGSDLQSDPPIPPDPLDPVDPVDPVQNSGKLIITVKNKLFSQFCRKMIAIFRQNYKKNLFFTVIMNLKEIEHMSENERCTLKKIDFPIFF